jgi:putative endonuclease
MNWSVYLLQTSKNTLYCGYTNDLNKRIAAHNKGRGAKYTKTRLPVKLVYSETFDNKIDALKREWQIKQLTRKEKLKLINDSK